MNDDLSAHRLFHAKRQQTFVLVTLLSCLVLQRFGLPSGSTAVSLAVPIVGGLAFWYLWIGVLTIDRARFGIFMSLVAIGLIAVSVNVNMPIPLVTRRSLSSLIYWLGITGFAVLRFAEPMDERVFFSIWTRCLGFIAVCGIVEFLAQFVGLKLFTFQGFLPPSFSMEQFYNVEIPLNGSMFKANGFFLVEPSTFSQFMALGLICEWLTEKRPQYLGLFLFALFCSASGTGWMIIATFVAYMACVKGGRGLGVALLFSFVCFVGFFAISFVFPDITNSLSGRISEFGVQGTSGNQRFVTPVLILKQVLHAAPWTFFTGIGPGGATSLAGVTFEYNMNTPIKILLEYGIFGLISYLTLIVWNRRTSLQNSLLLPALILLLFAGGNEHFPPILFPVLLLTTVFCRPPGSRAQVVPRPMPRLRLSEAPR